MRVVASMSAAKLFSISSFSTSRLGGFTTLQKVPFLGITTSAERNDEKRRRKKKKKEELKAMAAKSQAAIVKEKRRTRSERDFELEEVQRYGDTATHIPVMLGEVVDVFSTSKTMSLRSFVDCTVGAAGHSSAVCNSFPSCPFLYLF